jgi:hypothetical protein
MNVALDEPLECCQTSCFRSVYLLSCVLVEAWFGPRFALVCVSQ